ncbi:MAG: carbamoyltransferase HypF [Candidatus Aenigmatarchaeota archaeon]
MKLILKGTVQGVGFRPTVHRVAKDLGLKGYVKNTGSEVEVVIDKDPNEFLERLKEELPPLAEIQEVERYEREVSMDDFEIVRSSSGGRGSSTIPVDTALCFECIEEMKDPGDRRKGYPFTNCTNCGARYSAIYSLPYDRDKTTMEPFPLCEDCREEYQDPMDRRFHAQTISCPECGPSYTLYDKDKNEVGGVEEFCELLERGNIAVAKSWGGMHIACRLERIPELRRRYSRKEKPFAIMVRDVETASRYAKVQLEELFTGPRRPIMLFEKKDHEDQLMDYAAPDLPTIGMMLPYTGLHHMVFERLESDALVMTSANPPGEPMVIENQKAFELDADYFLLHNRKIANRIDDSLIRVHSDRSALIRRSRGYVPDFLDFEKGAVMGAGADQSGCLTLSKDGKLYPSQYLGDLGHYGNKEFYKDTFGHLKSLLGIEEIRAVGVDLHPKYQSRELGEEYASRYEAELFEIQHHWAHGASLMLEHDRDELVCIAVDGTGYGEDGNSWGGEILYCTEEGYERTHHLENFPLLGGEKAVEDIRRLAYAVEKKAGEEPEIYDDQEARIFEKMFSNSVQTSSYGRLLDAVSFALDVSSKRTYEGEPAMKLESLLYQGRNKKDYEIPISKGEIKTLDAFVEMTNDSYKREDRALSYVTSVSGALAEAASETAQSRGIESIGISGGVSYNKPIVDTIEKYLEDRGYELLVHNKVPNGDMGVPIGQAFIASKNSD